jgi:hypothetical protein
LCGWGGGMGFGGGFGGWGMMGMDMGLYPWLNNSQNINGGFRDQQIQTSIAGIQNSVTSGFGDVQTALCGGFAGVTAAVNGAQNAVSQQLYTNQIADMERSFAAQTASTQGMNALQSQLAQCCCDNRAATADLKYTVATENCADRTAAMQNTRDIIDNQNRTGQAILDKLCQLELDGERAKNEANLREINRLNTELMYARGQASQVEQTARILAGQAAEIDGVYNRLKNCPVNTVPVAGNTPLFTCNPGFNNGGCGCGFGGVAA